MFSSFNFNLELIEVERREHYLFHRLQIQLRNVLTSLVHYALLSI